jgi:hypothetical protein
MCDAIKTTLLATAETARVSLCHPADQHRSLGAVFGRFATIIPRGGINA